MSEDSTKELIKKKPKKNQADFGSPLKVTFIAIAIFLLGQLAAVFLLALIFGISQGEDAVSDLFEGSLYGSFAIILLTEIFTLLLVYKAIGSTKAGWIKIGLIKPKLKDIPVAGLGFIAYYVILFISSIIIYSLLPGIDTDQKQDLGFESATTNIELLIAFISLVILPPIGEEILMRGYLLTGLRSRLNLLPSMLIISSLFAIAHLQLGNGQAPLWAAAVNTFVLSVVLVYVKEKTGSLWPCIYIHGLNNLVAFTYLFKDSLF